MRIDIVRKMPGEERSHIQSFSYEPADETETVATALTALNARRELRDLNGEVAAPIRWDCGCLQKKCGACAMVINGRPGLACDARLAKLGGRVRLGPLRKFPVVADLIVDRGVMFDDLAAMRLWLEGEAVMSERSAEVGYEASRCLQCGCCLEVCPNFRPEGRFFGMAAAVPATRVLTALSPERRDELARAYRGHVYEGCGKSLACRNICPAGIDMEKMLVNSNAIAVWKRLLR